MEDTAGQSLTKSLRHFGIELNSLSSEISQKVQDRFDECHKKICEAGWKCCGRILPPTDKFIKSCYEWCFHDIINMVVKEVAYPQ